MFIQTPGGIDDNAASPGVHLEGSYIYKLVAIGKHKRQNMKVIDKIMYGNGRYSFVAHNTYVNLNAVFCIPTVSLAGSPPPPVPPSCGEHNVPLHCSFFSLLFFVFV